MNYPYMIVMRNEPSGMIWQAYEVRDELEERLLTRTARSNGFCVMKHEQGYTEESSPGWRDTPEWKAYRAKHEGEVGR